MGDMSAGAMRELLAAKIAADIEGDSLYYFLEVIEQRNVEDPAVAPINIDRAWADFQKCYHTPEGEEKPSFWMMILCRIPQPRTRSLLQLQLLSMKLHQMLLILPATMKESRMSGHFPFGKASAHSCISSSKPRKNSS